MKVIEKKVEQIELFYDLIYVYAISKLTLLIEEPVAGGILCQILSAISWPAWWCFSPGSISPTM